MHPVAFVPEDVLVPVDDPHGLKARMAAHNLRNRDLVDMLPASPNSVTRALNTTERSTTRPRIEALLDRLDREQGIPAARTGGTPAADKLAQIVGQSRLVEVRIEYGADGRSRRIVALTADNTLSAEEIDRLVSEWDRPDE